MPLGKKQTPVEKLKVLRSDYRKLSGGYRDEVRRLACETYRSAIKIRESKEYRRDFFDLVPLPGWGRKGKIIVEAMAFMMRAKSESQRKCAWKRARAVEFLHSNGTELDALEAELKSRGGLEAVAREAARADPRCNRAPRPEDDDSDQRDAGLNEFDHDLDEQDEDSGENGDDEEETGAPAREQPLTNDRLITLVAKIRSSDRTEIEECGHRSKLMLTVVRSKGGGPLVTVLTVKKL
jgi:hypothetical protein